jgi:hypothetical protein
LGARIAALERVGLAWRVGSEVRDRRPPGDIDRAFLTLPRHRFEPQCGADERFQRMGECTRAACAFARVAPARRPGAVDSTARRQVPPVERACTAGIVTRDFRGARWI